MEETNDRRAQPEPRLSQNDAGGSKGWGKRLRDRVPSDAHAGRGRVRVERTRSVSFAPRPAAWQKDLVTLDYGGMLPSRSRSTAGPPASWPPISLKHWRPASMSRYAAITT
jgi:hypothetical protein